MFIFIDAGFFFHHVLASVKVELPSVEENEEETLFSEWTKLFLRDCDVNKWKSCGAGDIKVLFHPVKKRYLYLLHWYTQSYHFKNANTSALQAYCILY
uniref:RanBD1 domain-containing protein n=1 Tax=Cyprinus carpio TaxID=7962 RepID=A0A8C1X395_CYPCA